MRGFDGRLDPVAYARIGAAFREAQAKRAHFGQKPVYDVGLYFKRMNVGTQQCFCTWKKLSNRAGRRCSIKMWPISICI